MKTEKNKPEPLQKAPTGVRGLDELTGGGLPKGRPTLLCGSAGCGKTLMAMEFLVRGAVEFDEPGVFLAFEEHPSELAVNFASLGHDLKGLIAAEKLAVDFVHIERSEIEETGEYDLEGLFIRLGHSIDSIGAKRVVLDTIEALFSGLSNQAILRAELRRLFRWLKEKGVTAIITGERGDASLTRYGLEEYVADCVILIDHRVTESGATRRLRIVKYRGSSHGTSEYPFLIDEGGISILPISSLGLDHIAPTERVSSGIDRLDAMMGGKGFYRASSILVTGTAGSGKTSLAAHFAAAAARRGERCLWFAFEESPSQIERNMRSIGIDLRNAVKKGRLQFHAERPAVFGLEMHLLTIHRRVEEFAPQVVVLDPITNFGAVGTPVEVKSMLTRLIDYFKRRKITAFFTSLTSGGDLTESTEVGVSSLMDTWLLLRDMESGAERNRLLHLLKSRGMAHSNQVREFLLTDDGVQLAEVYTGPSGRLLTGSARAVIEAEERAQQLARDEENERLVRQLERKRRNLEAQVAALTESFKDEENELTTLIMQDGARDAALSDDKTRMARLRQADARPSDGARRSNGGRK